MMFFIKNSYALDDKNNNRREREHAIFYHQGSYIPKTIVAFEGEDLIVHFGNFSRSPQCLWSKELDFFVSSYQGKVKSSKIEKLRPGQYHFTCPGETSPLLTLEVLAPKKEEKKVARLPASIVDKKIDWSPRDERDQFFIENKLPVPDDFDDYYSGGN